MKRVVIAIFLLLAVFTAGAQTTLKSPDGRMEARFELKDGVPYYSLYRDGKAVVLPSKMGFELEWREDLAHAFVLKKVERSSFDEVWHPVWGEEANIRNHYNEMLVTLEQPAGAVESADGRSKTIATVMQLRFRLYDDGLGFRYEFPTPNALVCFWFKEELTEFAMAGDHTAWWIPGDYDTQEYNYTESRLSQIDSLWEKSHEHGGWPWTAFSRTGVQTALQMKSDDGLYINIHEAATLDFPTMHLNLVIDTFPGIHDWKIQYTFRTWLCPDAAGYKGRMQAPCHTPWRTVMVCDKATDVLRSRLILNLNEPCALEDVSWIHPVKYMGVWWEMISGKSTWNYTNEYPSVRLGETDFEHAKPNGKHGANNANVRRYIDFAALHGFDALLIEGWNIGWEDWYGKQKDFVFDFLTPYPDFDLPALNKYAHEKGIRLIMHHESSASTVNYERWMEKAYTMMNQYGYDAVKSGYVGTIIPFAEGHYSQPINNHYHYAIVEAAKHHIMVNAHEAVRPTGLCRTWPNMIGNESAMGTEFRERIHPGHTTILPFTRLQGGPMDYTPGIFETDMGKIVPWGGKMQHTICNQLGLYVTFYSPLQMAADFPEHYEPFMDAFQFIKDVAVDWDTSIYLYAEPGAYIVTARKPKISSLNKAADGLGKLADGKKGVISSAAQYVYGMDKVVSGECVVDSIRGQVLPTINYPLPTPHDVWYVGGVTDEQAREFSVKLDFLKPGVTYDAIIYCDGKDASGLPGDGYNAQSYTITTKKVTSKTVLKLRMAPCGGFAVSIRSCGPLAENDPEVVAARALVNRVVPQYSKDIILERFADTIDRFELETKGGKLVIRGNNANSMAVGLNHYLKYYCMAQYSWFKEEPLEVPTTMPRVTKKVSHKARVKERFFLNYCTFGYTMPWWDWEQWEHFIDWMALQGINLPLAITGQEAVWYEVWREMGLTDDEIRSYFTGPAHLPWHRMQNIDRWGGPLPLSWLKNQKELQKKIVARERELDMKPVLPGFAGHVPPCIKRLYPDAPLASLGDWAGFDTSCWCHFLDPQSPLYADIQRRFIAKQTEFFGTDHIYGIDIFNEMIPPSWEPDYLARISRQVYESLVAADPDAVWLEMTWLFWNERQHWEVGDRIESYITSMPSERRLLLDYYCERQPVWERTDAYHGVPYIWCYLGNFGGNSMLAGNLDTVNVRIERAFEKGGKNFVGIGSTLEGFDCNPFMYEYVFEKAWDNPLTCDVKAWVERLADQRAGRRDPAMRSAWRLLADSVYNKVSSPGQTVRINQRPTMGDIKEYRQYYIAPTYNYSNRELLRVLDRLLATKGDSRMRHFDVVNVTRQLLGNYFGDLYADYVKAYRGGDYGRMHQVEQRMTAILEDTDPLLATESAFLLGRWIRDARAIGTIAYEQDYFESNARNLITTWGEEDALLNEYGSRAWAGLTATYYAYRWREFFREVNAAIEAGVPFDEKAYHDRICKYEGQWWRERIGTFSAEPQGDGVALARKLAAKYRAELEERYK